MIPIGWLFALERIAPGALLLLCGSALIAVYLTRRSARQAAHRLADEHRLVGEEREHFLAWSIPNQLMEANDHVFPVAVGVWSVLMVVCLSTGLMSCSGPPERPTPPGKSGLTYASSAGPAESGPYAAGR